MQEVQNVMLPEQVWQKDTAEQAMQRLFIATEVLLQLEIHWLPLKERLPTHEVQLLASREQVAQEESHLVATPESLKYPIGAVSKHVFLKNIYPLSQLKQVVWEEQLVHPMFSVEQGAHAPLVRSP